MEKIKQPIITVAGHVDHGKTTILDSIRGTCVASKEAGLITQKISFTEVPSEIIEQRCSSILKKFKIQIETPGFLFIDTPGHAAFSNLRKRGGALADLAVLVVDINEGIMEQTRESIDVLKQNKVPFIVALNKVDNIMGWHKNSEDLKDSIESQSSHTNSEFEKKIYRIIGQFVDLGFNPDLFYRINDFTKQLALIPCSGKTCEGLPELVAMLAGLAQKFLKGKLKVGEQGKGTILEIKKQKSVTEVEAILYDGTLSKNDNLIIATIDDAIEARPRTLFKAEPLGKGFKSEKEVIASSGIRMQFPADVIEKLVPGMPFVVENNKEKTQDIKEQLRQEIQQELELDDEGVIAKADSLGSLEALINLLKKEGILVKKASIGKIVHADLSFVSTFVEENPLNAAILAFNIEKDPEIDKIISEKKLKIKVIVEEVIYHIIEKFKEWQKLRAKEIEREKLSSMTLPCKLSILRNHCFRQSKPAIFGVRLEAGTLKSGTDIINQDGEKIDKIKALQSETKSLDFAEKGQEFAISLPHITFGRQLKESDTLYSDLNEDEFRNLKQNKEYLSSDEISVLQEIVNIKRKKKATWGI